MRSRASRGLSARRGTTSWVQFIHAQLRLSGYPRALNLPKDKIMKVASIFGACSIAFVLTACGPSESEQDLFAAEVAALTEQAKQDDAARNEPGAMTAAGEAGDPGVAAATSVTVPENFPGDVVLHPNMTLSSATGMSDTMMLQGEVADDIAAIADFYQRQMEAQGWVDESDPAGADIGMRRLRFTQEDRVVDVTLTPRGDETAINLALSPRL